MNILSDRSISRKTIDRRNCTFAERLTHVGLALMLGLGLLGASVFASAASDSVVVNTIFGVKAAVAADCDNGSCG